ncbi:4-oxalocrotonate tautomerase [Orenia metallireducens]|jgi:4-oxalocrotonate tautomerase|uniref:4-oxalocrotonate tautomerase n=1 Tax=Orenia metallireducens TaxID=1413210 RepID=A0A285GWL9_9FIRM|nr:tautomerase family protein [Orenia metallireducens]SNY27969.1 4-oxalocrotonate tautomerase [Orenia metallireducens]
MPYINLKLAKGRTIEQKKRFVKAITKEAVEILNVKAEWVTVVTDEYDRSNWATGGELHSIKFGEGCGKMGVEEKVGKELLSLKEE